MKRVVIYLVSAAATMMMVGCSAAFYSQAGAYDDLYATHDTNAIAARQKAEAEARKAEAEARKAEAAARLAAEEAQRAQWEAEIGRMIADAEVKLEQGAQSVTYRTDADGLIIVDEIPVQNNYSNYGNSYQDYVADNYESAYARRLQGFSSPTYRMPSSYYNLRYGGAYNYVTAYDPAFYNIMVSGDQVWVEPKYITSMFGTWGATVANVAVYSPWYYGWSGYDPFYDSWWGYPHYSWYDWNWNICYSPVFGVSTWWGWRYGYHPIYNPHYWRDYYNHYYGYHHPHHGPTYGPHHGHHNPPHWNGSDRTDNRYNHYYGSRGNNTRFDGTKGSSGRSTPYRSPNNGQVYGQGGSRGSNSPATVNRGDDGRKVNRTPGSVGRGSATPSRGGSTVGRPSGSGQKMTGTSSQGPGNSSRGTSYRGNSSGKSSSSKAPSQSGSSSRSGSSYKSGGSSSRSSSYTGGSSSSRGSSYSSGSRSGGSRSGGYSGGGGGSSSRGGGGGGSRGGR